MTARIGTTVSIIAKGAVIGGGEVVAIDGRDILIAQTTEVVISGDGAVDTLDRTELSLDRYTLGRGVIAREIR